MTTNVQSKTRLETSDGRAETSEPMKMVLVFREEGVEYKDVRLPLLTSSRQVIFCFNLIIEGV